MITLREWPIFNYQYGSSVQLYVYGLHCKRSCMRVCVCVSVCVCDTICVVERSRQIDWRQV
jgi:hypothetical protein